MAASAKPSVSVAGLTGTPIARLGGGFRGGGFGSRPGFGRRTGFGGNRGFGTRRRGFGRGFGRGILTGLGISFLLHSLFGYGSGGSPFGLLLLLGLILFFVSRRRRRRASYGY